MIGRAFHRAAVAIVLMATVLVPYGSCRPQVRIAAHDCCPQAAYHAAVIEQDCCIARASIPAMITERPAYNSTPMLLPYGFVAAVGLSAPTDRIATTPGVAFSPPPGASVLRI